MVATAIYSVTMVLWKETAFPLCRAMERRWKRNVVSRLSSVIVVIRLPIPCVSSVAIWCHMYQLFLWQMGRRCVCWPIWSMSILFCAVFWAAAPGLVAVLPMWDSAYVSGTVTFHAVGFPLAHDVWASVVIPHQDVNIIIILYARVLIIARVWRITGPSSTEPACCHRCRPTSYGQTAGTCQISIKSRRAADVFNTQLDKRTE